MAFWNFSFENTFFFLVNLVHLFGKELIFNGNGMLFLKVDWR